MASWVRCTAIGCSLFKSFIALNFTLLVLSFTSQTAQAQCVEVGGVVTCLLDDNNGFASAGDIIDFTINNGVTVDDSAADIANGIILINGNLTGTLVNNGTISDLGLDAHGVRVISTLNNLINNGSISAGNDGVFAITINNLINNGSILAGDEGVFATTITSLINNGSISAGNRGVLANTITSLINNGSISAGFDGVRANSTLTNLVNNGSIIAGFNGVRANSTLTNLVNNGSIIAVFNGVHANNIEQLTNAGIITSGVIFSAIIEFGASDTLLTLLPGSDIFGAIDLGGGTNTLVVGNGLSIDHEIESDTALNINSNGAPFVEIDLGGNVSRVVVVDTTMLAQQDEILFDLSQGIWGTVFNNIGDGRNPGGTAINALGGPQYSLGALAPAEQPLAYNQSHIWASVLGNRRIQNENSTIASARHDLSGFIGGVDGRVNSSLRLGGFFGFSETDINTTRNQQDAEVDSFFGGLYASMRDNNLVIDVGLTGGVTDHDNTRLVDNNQVLGLERVTSSFDGTFIAPEISMSRKLDVSGLTLQPTLRAGYAGLFLDGHTERGASAPLTVSDRDIHILHARLEMALLMHSQGPDSLGFHFSPYLGFEGRSLVGGEAVHATLLGQNLSFTPGEEDVASAFAGFRFSVAKSENFGLFAGVEGSLDTEESSTFTGNLGVKWRF